MTGRPSIEADPSTLLIKSVTSVYERASDRSTWSPGWITCRVSRVGSSPMGCRTWMRCLSPSQCNRASSITHWMESDIYRWPVRALRPAACKHNPQPSPPPSPYICPTGKSASHYSESTPSHLRVSHHLILSVVGLKNRPWDHPSKCHIGVTCIVGWGRSAALSNTMVGKTDG